MADPTEQQIDASGARFAIVVSRFNTPVTRGLLNGALEVLRAHDIEGLEVFWCPGAVEIPLVAKKLAERRDFDAIISLGAVIKGETYHFEVISDTVVRALQRVALDTGIPVALGVITPLTKSQALERSGPTGKNKGREAALAAIEMVHILRQLQGR